MKTLTKTKIVSIFALLIVLTSFLIYYPGLNGPFIFDDFDNIVNNKSVHIQDLSLDTIQKAANSLTSGIFGRPVAALSFAFNYYLTDAADNPFGFKLFNILIHGVNGILVLWLAILIFTRLKKHSAQPLKYFSDNRYLIALAGGAALLWVAHPIQLTSVLYTVQRMTSLAAMFMLLALICYLYGRTALLKGRRTKGIFWLTGLPAFGLMAVFCKETGLLLPLYIVILELVLFSNVSPWNRWLTLSKKIRPIITAGVGIAIIFLVIAAVLYSIPTYSGRNFTLIERLLTEARVLVFYIGQILVPRLSSFGLYHDDFVISHSLFEPWSTLPAIITIIGFLGYALIARHRQPLLSLGVLWFFASHVLESTVYPFELVHEHRNYLASLGLIFVLISFLIWVSNRYQNKKIWLFIPVLLLFFSFTTLSRSNQWNNLLSLLQTQAEHHPASPRAWMDLANTQSRNQQYKEAVSSARKAVFIKPQEPAYPVYLYLYANLASINLSPDEESNILKSIRANPKSTQLSNLFHKIDGCIESSCKYIQLIMEKWLRTALEQTSSPRYRYYLGSNLSAQGKLDEALYYLNLSIKEGPNHISPYIDKIEVLLKLGNLNKAKQTYVILERVSNKLYDRNTGPVNIISRKISEHEADL